MSNRTRKQRALIKKVQSSKRKDLDRVTETGASPDAVPSGTTDDQGVRGLLCTPSHIRSDLQMLQKYMGVGQFTEDELKGMVQAMGGIVAKGDDRQKIQAFRTLLAQTKLSYDMSQDELGSNPKHIHTHDHLHVESHSGTGELASIAAEIGLSIHIERDGEAEGDIIDGTADVPGTPADRRPSAEE